MLNTDFVHYKIAACAPTLANALSNAIGVRVKDISLILIKSNLTKVKEV